MPKAMSVSALGPTSFSLVIPGGINGLPTQGSVDLQAWISHQAHAAFRSEPPPRLQPIAGSAMSALLAMQAAM
jgi:hypothetical protein